jgi:dolichyl-phosphate beta-glucosyltransferase
MQPVLSLVIPAYNEADRLPPSLERVRAHLDSTGEEYEVIVVDDGSDDATAAVAQRVAQSWPQLEVVVLSQNTGKGGAIRAGILRARGEHRGFSDADLSTPIEDLPRLRSRLSGRCHVAIASRAAPGARIAVRQERRRELMGKTYNRILRLVALPGIRDSQCGFKVFTADAAVSCFEPLRTMRFGFDAEVLVRARRMGWEIAEVPVSGWRHVEASRVHPLRDSSRMLLDLLLLRLRGT